MSTPDVLLSLLWANLYAQAAADAYAAAGSPMGPDAGEREARLARSTYRTKLQSYGVSIALLDQLAEFARTTDPHEFHAAVDLMTSLRRT